MKKGISLVFLIIPFWVLSQPLIDVAKEHYVKQEWDLAYSAYQEITKLNPYNGRYWYRYGYCSLKTNHLDEAIHANLLAIELSPANSSAMYNLGSSYALKRDMKNALIWLEKAVQHDFGNKEKMLNDPNLETLYGNAHFMALVSNTTTLPEDRVLGWRMDLKYLTGLVETQHKQFNHTISIKQWEELKQRLYEEIPRMNDLQIIGSFMALMAKIGDGHTLLYPPFQGKNAFSALPLEFYMFNNELYVRGADMKYSSLVGTKVIKMGTMPVDKIIGSSSQYLGHDNTMQLKWIIPIALTFGEMHELIGTGNDSKSIDLTLRTNEGTSFNITVETAALARDPMSRFVPQHWQDMRGTGMNLWTKDPENYYWYEYLVDKKVVYCQFNQVRDKADQSLADFSEELFGFIDSHDVEALILDIRLNNGGNSFLNRSFIHEITRNEKINRHGKLFAIIGRRTFSAAMNFASDLENNTPTIFVGEPTGSKPNFYGEDNEFVLPYSALTGSISSRYWQGGQTSDDTRIWIAPHLAADLSADQYRNNNDPALKAIFDYLEAFEE